MMTNRYPGSCLTCRARVAAEAGLAVQIDGKWSVYCAAHAPGGARPQPAAQAPQDASIALRMADGRVQIRPNGYLGPDLFDRYRSACGGADYSRTERCNYASAELVGAIVTRLGTAGFKLDVDPAVTAAVQAWEARAQADTAAAAGRAAEIDTALRARGLALFPFQAQGVSWLAPLTSAILADDQGCIDGDAEIRINRAGRGFAIKLAELCHRFNGGRITGGKFWDQSIPTFVRSLCEGVLRMHKVERVIDQGIKPVVKLTTSGGKTLRLTRDHEVAMADGSWCRADQLSAGATILTNGTPACSDCGSTDRVVTYRYARFRGLCRDCVYRKHRAKPTWKGGRSLDKDGYVLISGQYHHPRAIRGQMREHHLVMEAHLGRMLMSDEIVHHKNGIKDDNRLENLELMTESNHRVHHGHDGGFLRMDGGRSGKGGVVTFVPKIDTVASVQDDGETHVYDIVCADPHRNFVANGIIVHNCGKSVQSLASLPENAPILVVCPAVAKGVWKRESARWRPDLRVTVLEGRGSFRWPVAGEMIVINYDLLPASPLDWAEHGRRAKLEKRIAATMDAETRAELEEKLAADDRALAFFATAPAGLCVIADEAQAVKGARKKVARSANFGAIADATYDVAKGRVWILTATPLENRPTELWNLLSLIRSHKVVFGNYNNFKKLCGGVDGGWGTQWHAGGIQTSLVAPKLKQVMLRRLKVDVLDQLPAKTVEVIDITLDADSIKRLDAIKAELAAQGIDLMEALKAAAENREVAFDQISRARKILATAKAAAAMDLADDLEEAGEPCIVFSAHRAPIDTLAKRPGWAAITGDTLPAERTRIEDAFQRGEYRGIAATIKAAGVAITLTRACNAIFIDSEWNPSKNLQAEDRIWRIGSSRAVTIRYLKADHEIDERVFEICAIKRGIVARTVDAAAHRDGALAERTNAAELLASSKVSGDLVQRAKDDAELADRVRRERAEAEADRVRRKATVKAESANQNRGWGIPAEAFDTPPRAAHTAAELWAVQGLAQLTAMDGDFAHEVNGVGFNQADTHVGHALAPAAAAGQLSDGEWMAAIQLLRKYSGQIGQCPADDHDQRRTA